MPKSGKTQAAMSASKAPKAPQAEQKTEKCDPSPATAEAQTEKIKPSKWRKKSKSQKAKCPEQAVENPPPSQAVGVEATPVAATKAAKRRNRRKKRGQKTTAPDAKDNKDNGETAEPGLPAETAASAQLNLDATLKKVAANSTNVKDSASKVDELNASSKKMKKTCAEKLSIEKSEAKIANTSQLAKKLIVYGMKKEIITKEVTDAMANTNKIVTVSKEKKVGYVEPYESKIEVNDEFLKAIDGITLDDALEEPSKPIPKKVPSSNAAAKEGKANNKNKSMEASAKKDDKPASKIDEKSPCSEGAVPKIVERKVGVTFNLQSMYMPKEVSEDSSEDPAESKSGNNMALIWKLANELVTLSDYTVVKQDVQQESSIEGDSNDKPNVEETAENVPKMTEEISDVGEVQSVLSTAAEEEIEKDEITSSEIVATETATVINARLADYEAEWNEPDSNNNNYDEDAVAQETEPIEKISKTRAFLEAVSGETVDCTEDQKDLFLSEYGVPQFDLGLDGLSVCSQNTEVSAVKGSDADEARKTSPISRKKRQQLRKSTSLPTILNNEKMSDEPSDQGQSNGRSSERPQPPSNDDQTQNTEVSIPAKLIAHFKQNRIDGVMWATRLAILIFTVNYILPIFGSAQSAFSKVLLANAATSALRLHQRQPTFKFSREFLARLILEDSFHYLFYSIIYYNVQPTLFILIPIVLFALLHFSSYSQKLLDLIGQNSWWGARFLISLVEFQAAKMLRAAALAEIFIMPVNGVLAITGRAGILTPILYYHFLLMRYTSRRNPATRHAFGEIRMTTENLAARSPPIVAKVLRTLISLISRLAPQATPVPAQ